MKKALFFLLLPLLLMSCQRPFTVKDNQVLVPCKEMTIRLQVVAPDIIRVSAVPGDRFNDRASLAVVPQGSCRDFEVT
ncbi:MAG: DUF4968 domain-containing protein, partial [Bacteroidales bacterium]|nr:DUF4968 domain-containing protein [Bacteroidales bacterium]